MSVTDCHILNPPCSYYWLPPYLNTCILSSIQFPAASCRYPIIYCCSALFQLERCKKWPASKSVTKAASHNSSSAFMTGARLGHWSFYVLWHTQAGDDEHSKVKFWVHCSHGNIDLGVAHMQKPKKCHRVNITKMIIAGKSVTPWLSLAQIGKAAGQYSRNQITLCWTLGQIRHSAAESAWV